VTFGAFDITPLIDASFRLDGGAMFGTVPKPMWEKRTIPDARNRIPLRTRPLLVRNGSDVILIDAGIGGKMSAKEVDIYGIDREPGLEGALATHGIVPADVTVVIASHLHFDHVGGLTTNVDGVVVPTFPNAVHHVRRGEWEDATHPHERSRASYMADNFRPLEAAGLIAFHDEDCEILPGISVRRTGGHTMHHELIRLDGGGRVGIFTADLMPTAAHVDLPWIMGYDLYPMDTLAYKKRFIPEAIAGEYVIFFEHDPAIAAGVITESNGRLSVRPFEGA
jgi:glyoxylase-like metal-dependent hydrolase (beta-lactamase superfamily II)